MNFLLIIPLVLAAVSAYFLTPLVIKLMWKWGVVDDPKTHRHPKVIHTKPTPRGGGLAIFVVIFVLSLILLPLDKHLLGILAGAIILVILGILDDKHDLHPYPRLLLQFIAAGIPIATGIGIAFLNTPIGMIDLSHPQIVFDLLGDQKTIWILADVMALVWIVMIMNFLNWGANGIDGQLTGTVAIAALVVGLLSLQFSADIAEWPVTILAALTAGAFLGFLPWHAFPQKIMPGFTGAMLGGYLLAVLSILTTTKVGVLAVVLGVPLIDSGYTILRRIASGRSPFWGDRGHLHHRLLDSGWKKSHIMSFYWTVSLFLGLIALNLNTDQKLYTMVGLLFLIGGIILWLTRRKPLSG